MNLSNAAGESGAPVTSRDSAIALIEKGNTLEEQGRADEAMECYQAAVQADPQCARAHLNCGNILFASDCIEEARDAYQLAIDCDPKYAAAHFNLGNLNYRVREYEQAVHNFESAIQITPEFADAYITMGNALDELGRAGEAKHSYQRALEICPDHPEVHFNLGVLATNRGELTEAAALYKRAIDLGTTNPMASYMLAAWSGANTGSIPDASIRDLFDDYASRFETHLVDALGYSMPKLMRAAVGRLTRNERRFRRALDLGCGTGLIGESFEDIVDEIDGVDLSPNMLEQSAFKKIYGNLDCGEIVAWLERTAAESRITYDIVLSADVFIYVGNLERAFKATRRILADNGLFVFSVEHLAQGAFELLPTGRYAHGASYVRELASTLGFGILLSEQVDLRKEKNVMIGGTIFVLTPS